MTGEQNKSIVRSFYKAFENSDLAVLERVLAPDLVAYNLTPQNRDEHIKGILSWNTMFGDNHFEIVSQIAEGDQVSTHVIMRCKHTRAEYQGIPPSGKQLEIPAVTIERIKDGKIVERRVFSDRLGMLKQLGILS